MWELAYLRPQLTEWRLTDLTAIKPNVYSAICSKGPTVIPGIPSYTATRGRTAIRDL